MTKETRTLLVIILVLALLVLLDNQFQTGSGGISPDNFSLDTAKVTTVRIVNGANEVILRKSASGWTVANGNGVFPADKNKTHKLLASLAAMTPVEMVAQENDTAYIKPDEAYTVELYGGDELLKKLYVGKTIERDDEFFAKYNIKGYATYVLFGKNGGLWLVNGDFSSVLGHSPDFFRSNKVWNLNLTSLKRIEIFDHEQRKIVARKMDNWFVDGKDANKYVVRLVNLECPEFYYGDLHGSPSARIVVYFTGGKTVLKFYDAGDFYILVSAGRGLFKCSKKEAGHILYPALL